MRSGGGAPLFYDHARKANRYATREDFLATIRLAEGLPEVVTMGNGVHCLKESDGTDLPPKMVAIRGAALVARHSSKPGCTSIIDRRQLPFLRELGAIIEDMARAGLSIFILPMPLIGISTPVYPAAASIVAAAETVLADLAVAQLFRERYGVPCGTGVGLIDAPVPGALSLYERTFKALGCALAGEPAFPVGIIGGLHLDSEHTALHFRERLMLPNVLPRLKSTDIANARAHDPVELAHQRYREILKANPLCEVSEDCSRAIERVVGQAQEALAGIRGAME